MPPRPRRPRYTPGSRTAPHHPPATPLSRLSFLLLCALLLRPVTAQSVPSPTALPSPPSVFGVQPRPTHANFAEPRPEPDPFHTQIALPPGARAAPQPTAIAPLPVVDISEAAPAPSDASQHPGKTQQHVTVFGAPADTASAHHQPPNTEEHAQMDGRVPAAARPMSPSPAPTAPTAEIYLFGDDEDSPEPSSPTLLLAGSDFNGPDDESAQPNSAAITLTTPAPTPTPEAPAQPHQQPQPDVSVDARTDPDPDPGPVPGSAAQTGAGAATTTTLQVGLELAPHPVHADWSAADAALRNAFARASRTRAEDWRLVASDLRAQPPAPRSLTYQTELSGSGVGNMPDAQKRTDAVAAAVRSGAAGALAGIAVTLASEPELGAARRDGIAVPDAVSRGEPDNVNGNGEGDGEGDSNGSGGGNGAGDGGGSDGDSSAQEAGDGAEDGKRSRRDVAMALSGAGGAAGVALLAVATIAAAAAARRRRRGGDEMASTAASSSVVELPGDRGASRSDVFSSAEIVAV